jgi:hypothetical protein
MIQPGDERRKSAWQLVGLAALMAFGYFCIRTLRFTNEGFNLGFVCAFLFLPFLAIRPVLRLHHWPKALTTILLAPLLAISVLALLFTVACNIPAFVEHRELARELSTVTQGSYSVHLLWEETAGGALGSHGVILEQRMFLVPGLYVVRHLDYFKGAHNGSVFIEAPNTIKVHIGKLKDREEMDKFYSLKSKVYF